MEVNSNESKSYSSAFEKLSADENELVAALAYFNYKKQKIELIKENGLQSDSPEVKHYHKDLNQSRIDSLKELARVRIERYSDLIRDRSIESIRESIEEGALFDELKNQYDKTEELSKKIEQLNTDFKNSSSPWKAIGIGVASSAVFALILTAAKHADWTNPYNEIFKKQEQVEAPKKAPTDAPATPPRQ